MTGLEILGVAVVGGLVVLYFASDKFKLFTKTHYNQALDKNTDPVEAERVKLNELKSKAEKAQALVAQCMGAEQTAHQDLEAAQAKKTKAEDDFKRAASAPNFPASALEQLAATVESSENEVHDSAVAAEAAKNASMAAQDALELEHKKLNEFAAQIKKDATDQNVAKVNEIAAQAVQAARSAGDASDIGQAHDAVRARRAASEAALQLAQGDRKEREAQKALDDLNAADRVAKLKAKLGVGQPASPPADGSQSK